MPPAIRKRSCRQGCDWRAIRSWDNCCGESCAPRGRAPPVPGCRPALRGRRRGDGRSRPPALEQTGQPVSVPRTAVAMNVSATKRLRVVADSPCDHDHPMPEDSAIQPVHATAEPRKHERPSDVCRKVAIVQDSSACLVGDTLTSQAASNAAGWLRRHADDSIHLTEISHFRWGMSGSAGILSAPGFCEVCS